MKAQLEVAKFLMPHHSLTNFEIQKYYQNQPKFNGVYSSIDLIKIKDTDCVVTLEKFKSIETQWMAFYVNDNNEDAFYDAIYFDSFGVEHILKKI